MTVSSRVYSAVRSRIRGCDKPHGFQPSVGYFSGMAASHQKSSILDLTKMLVLRCYDIGKSDTRGHLLGRLFYADTAVIRYKKVCPVCMRVVR